MSCTYTFVSSRLDYCNSLLHGTTDSQIQRLQSVQNAAARLVTGTRRTDHITPILRSLRWLPVRQRIKFKLAMLVHNCLNDRAPKYLVDDCDFSGGRRLGLRSSGNSKLEIRQTKTKFGDRSFAVAGPTVWNSLPDDTRNPTLSASTFRRLLKKHLFV